MTSSNLLRERRGAVLLLTLNRPETHNALDHDLLAALGDAVAGAARSGDVRAVVVTGAGERAFSAGADLRELAEMGLEAARATIDQGQAVLAVIESCGLPVIAAVNGLALGGGFELALACTFPVLSTSARLGLPESSLGLMPGFGGTQRLPRMVGPAVAAHVMLTGARLDAARSFDLGLSPVPPVEPEQLLDTSLELARTIAAQGPRAVRSILGALRLVPDTSQADGLVAEAGLAAGCIAGEESGEGITAFLEKRPAQYADLPGDDR